MTLQKSIFRVKIIFTIHFFILINMESELITLYDDDYKVTKRDYVKNFLETDFLQNNIILVG